MVYYLAHFKSLFYDCLFNLPCYFGNIIHGYYYHDICCAQWQTIFSHCDSGSDSVLSVL